MAPRVFLVGWFSLTQCRFFVARERWFRQGGSVGGVGGAAVAPDAGGRAVPQHDGLGTTTLLRSYSSPATSSIVPPQTSGESERSCV